MDSKFNYLPISDSPMNQVLLHFSNQIQAELFLHAEACGLPLPQLLERLAISLVESGRPAGCEAVESGELLQLAAG